MTSLQQRDRTLADGLSYDEFVAAWDASLAAPLAGLTPEARKYRLYAKYNRDRSTRVHAAYTPSEALRAALAAAPPLTVLVLTEDWCGDSAFVLPVLADAFAADARHALRILPRDAHLDVMDLHLTNGGRSIPKLVAFDAEGNEVFTWGPRSASGQAHRATLVAEGLDYAATSAKMVEWYETGRWMDVEAELVEHLAALSA